MCVSKCIQFLLVQILSLYQRFCMKERFVESIPCIPAEFPNALEKLKSIWMDKCNNNSGVKALPIKMGVNVHYPSLTFMHQ